MKLMAMYSFEVTTARKGNLSAREPMEAYELSGDEDRGRYVVVERLARIERHGR